MVRTAAAIDCDSQASCSLCPARFELVVPDAASTGSTVTAETIRYAIKRGERKPGDPIFKVNLIKVLSSE
jgi:positive regulator of sigma E activity